MYRFFKSGRTVLLFCLSATLLFGLEAEQTQTFKLQSGLVVYSINGGGILTPDLNLTIRGEGELRFKEWGKTALLEEKIEERTFGTLQDIEKFNKCIKHDKTQQYDVNYENMVILERPIPKGKELRNITDGMFQHGEKVVAGKTCEVWAKEGVRICLYKGIPLLVEKELFGIYYTKKALFVNENIDVDTQKCSIPDFPVQKIALFKTSIQQKQGPAEVSQLLGEMLNEITLQKNAKVKKMKKTYLNRLGKHIFEKQKILLPELLESMKLARECLYGADDKLEANDCIKEINIFKAKMVKENEDEKSIEIWDAKEKNKILDEFDENISILESRMKCIRAAKNITDLSRCMRK
ncbi:hypothetical protein [Sulfurovum sp. NBC37-1]|uniref:hypothetical protein n=1 Tax=Sulfurovum sp. (strain NBC37-1) TaxID=387093 RepID=UPI0011D14479|nr:hypothetical protein [Sulfurovum sp. NBC37-1]